METLKQRISTDYVAAFKSGNKIKKNLLGVVKGEITTVEKNTNVSDADVIKILTKMSKNLKETISASGSEETKLELESVEIYLPKQMSEEEIKTEVQTVISEIGATSPGDMGKVMSGFNVKFAGKADGKTVSNIVKQLLATKI